MNDQAKPVYDPQELETTLVSSEWEGDVDGMVALYEPNAVVDTGAGLLVGKEAIRNYFVGVVASGRKYERGVQQAAIITGDLALTSTRLSDGVVTAEIARRQSDGSWLWVIDRFSIA